MKKNGKYVNYYYDLVDKELIEDIEKYINKNAKKVFDFFDYVPNDKVSLYLISSKKEYDKKIQELRNDDSPIPLWNVGTTTYDNRIYFLSLYDYKNIPFKDISVDEYLKSSFHEFVHFVTISYCNKHNYNIPCKCLLEGIAEYFSNQKENIELEFKCSLEDVLSSFKAYDEWLLITKYIIDNYSKEYFFNLLKDYDYALEEIKKIYGKVEKKRKA